jgi:hypothetical protein
LLLLLLLLQVDRDTLDMLKAINMASLPGVTMQQVRRQQYVVVTVADAATLVLMPACTLQQLVCDRVPSCCR